MRYCSTRDNTADKSACEVILQGISAEGGLFVPKQIPELDLAHIGKYATRRYDEIVADILARFMPELKEELPDICAAAYGTQFGEKAVGFVKTGENAWALELWHGPTCAFKDMALQVLPRVVPYAKAKTGYDKQSVILVATSGDTGKAALEGFKDIDGVKIMVLYPHDGVSETQRLQMITQSGQNVFVAGIDGNFDDAQRTIKALMTDTAMIEKLGENNMAFSSANSINWGRLAPQIAYYFYSYVELVACGEIALGDKVNFCVPSGNFGNILAAYYAFLMGLPVNRLICASNKNDVLVDFIQSGVYDANRSLQTTISPSMDILVSSNIERLVWLVCGNNGARVQELFGLLKRDRRFELNTPETDKVKSVFSAYRCDEDATCAELAAIWNQQQYLIDPHTAVAYGALKQYRAETGDETPTVVVSTASPYKFASSVVQALGEQIEGENAARRLEELTKTKAPRQLTGLDKLEKRFDNCYKMELITDVLSRFLGLD